MKIRIAILLTTSLLTSCASVRHIPMSPQQKSEIKTIAISENIEKPKKMYEFVSGAQFGMAFGAIGGAIAGSANANAAKTTQEFVEKNNISIQKIIYNEWQQEITEKSRFKLAKNNSDATLNTQITMYGLSIPHGFSTDYVPILALNATLKRNNKIIWQDSGSVMPLTSGMPHYKMKELLNDPHNFQVMWEKASKRIIDEMIIDMNK